MPILDTRHDRAHPVGDDPDWSESYYFNGYAPESGIGLFARIGIKPHRDSMRGFLLLWLPDGRLARIDAERPQSEMIDTDLVVDGIQAQCLAPMQAWRLSAGGRTDLGEVSVEARFEALTPAIGLDAAAAERDSARDAVLGSLATGHFEQAGRWRGTVTLGADAFPFEGLGMRDKSWGPRRTDGGRGLRMWRWFSINLGDDLHLGGIRVGTEGGEVHRGWMWRDGQAVSLRRWDMRTRLAADGLTQQAIEMVVTDKTGARHELSGEVLRAAPFPVLEMHGTRVLEGLTRWRHRDREGYGIAEYAHVMGADGRPLAPID